MSTGRRLFAIALLLAIILLLTMMCRAAHVQFQWSQFGLQTDLITNRTFTITPRSAPGAVGPLIITMDRRQYTNDATGSAIVSNVVAGTYAIDLSGPFSKTPFLITVPNTNGLIQAASLISSPTNFAAHPFYVQHVDGDLASPANFFTKGIIAGTNILVENWTNRVRLNVTGVIPGGGGNLNQFTNVALWGNATNINNFWLLGNLRVPNMDVGAITYVDSDNTIITDGTVMYTNVALRTQLNANQFGAGGGGGVSLKSEAYMTNTHVIASAHPALEAWSNDDPSDAIVGHNELQHGNFPVDTDWAWAIGTETQNGYGRLELADSGSLRHVYIGRTNSIIAGALSIGTNDISFTKQTGPPSVNMPAQLHVYQSGGDKPAVRIQTAGGTNDLLQFYAGATAVGGVNSNGFVTLPGAPTASLHAATKAYVDAATNGLAISANFVQKINSSPFTNTGPVTLSGGLTNTGTTLLNGSLFVTNSFGIGTTTPGGRLQVTVGGQTNGLILSKGGDSDNNWAVYRQGGLDYRMGLIGSTIGDAAHRYRLSLYGGLSPSATAPGSLLQTWDYSSGAVAITSNLYVGTNMSGTVTVGRNASASTEVVPLQQLILTNDAVLATAASRDITTSNGVVAAAAVMTNALRAELLGQPKPLGASGLTNIDLSIGSRRYHPLVGNEHISLTTSTNTYSPVVIHLTADGSDRTVTFPTWYRRVSGGTNGFIVAANSWTKLVIEAVTNNVYIDWSGTNAAGGGTLSVITGDATNLTVWASNTIHAPLTVNPRTGTTNFALRVNGTNGNLAFSVSSNGNTTAVRQLSLSSNVVEDIYTLPANDGTGTNFLVDFNYRSWVLNANGLTNLINIIHGTNQLSAKAIDATLTIFTGPTNRHLYLPQGWYRADTNVPINLSSNRAYIFPIKSVGLGETNILAKVANPRISSPLLPLDYVPDSLWAAYSAFRKLRRDYAGYAYQMRIGGDTITFDIPFTADGLVDTNYAQTILAACTATNAAGHQSVLTTWYDQSGNGNNLTTEVSGDQVFAYFQTNRYALSNGVAAVNTVGNRYITNLTASLDQPITVYWIGQKTNETDNLNLPLYDGGTSGTTQISRNGNSSELVIDAGATVGPITFAANSPLLLTAKFNGASSSVRKNNEAHVTGNAGSDDPNGITVGGNVGALSFAHSLVTTLVVYNTAHADSGTPQSILTDKLNASHGLY